MALKKSSLIMDVNPSFITAHIPPHFLKRSMLLGSNPLKALVSDLRLSYNLYVPPSHYNPNSNHPSSQGEDSYPSYSLPRIPLVINIHGTGRDVGSRRQHLISLADSECFAILAPLFPASLDHEFDLDSYKLCRSKTLRSDLALLDMVSEVAARYPGIDNQKFFLVGSSGGGHFVHRFSYVRPEMVIAASIGSPGRVTHWDKMLKWPKGVADLTDVFGENVHIGDSLESLRDLKAVRMIDGGEDVDVPGDDFNEWTTKMKDKDLENTTLEPMRMSGVETLRTLHGEWKALGIRSTFEIVAGVKHDLSEIYPAVERFLEPWIRDW